MLSGCSLELSAAYFQSVSSVFLSQQISQQYFQPLIFSQANKLCDSQIAYLGACHCRLALEDREWRMFQFLLPSCKPI
jgi:hypothetical protein